MLTKPFAHGIIKIVQRPMVIRTSKSQEDEYCHVQNLLNHNYFKSGGEGYGSWL